MSRRHVVVAARWLAPSPLESEVTAARRSRAEVALVVVRMVEERRSCGGRWPSGGRHKKHTKNTSFWPQPQSHAIKQNKKQKGPVASRQRKLVTSGGRVLACTFKREFRPACSCSTRTTRTTRTCDFPHNAPPLVRLEHPEQRTTAGPVDREHPVFVRLVRVKSHVVSGTGENSPKTTGKSHPKRHKTAIFACCGAGGLIHHRILFWLGTARGGARAIRGGVIPRRFERWRERDLRFLLAQRATDHAAERHRSANSDRTTDRESDVARVLYLIASCELSRAERPPQERRFDRPRRAAHHGAAAVKAPVTRGCRRSAELARPLRRLRPAA